MTDKIIAIFSLFMFIGFVGIIVTYINEPALWTVVLIVVAMAVYDFWRALRRGNNHRNG
ncbi:MAG: hypothetical protein ACE5DS_04225 [Kiloniellaceae bacterium]